MNPGDALEELLAGARSEAFFVAPFIKAPVMSRLLELLPDGVQLTVVSRWTAQEVIAGVSDIEVWDLLGRGDRGRMILHPQLHAKYYRVDDRALLGSANLTGAALGWSSAPNIELLEAHAPLPEFEELLMQQALEPTTSLYEQLALLVREVQAAGADEEVWTVEIDDRKATWLPSTRHPEILWSAYVGDAEQLTRTGLAQTRADLRRLDLPPGLSETAFRHAVAAGLMAQPVLIELDGFLEEPRRFGAVCDWFVERLELDHEAASLAWQTTLRWLTHYLPGRYTRTRRRFSEVVARVDGGSVQPL